MMRLLERLTPLAVPSRWQALRETNRRLSILLETLIVRGQPVVATPEQMTALLSELLQAGATLRLAPLPVTGLDLEFDRELTTYRCHIERLRDLLPSLHCQLLAERTRLEAQRSRVQSAGHWARAARQTI